MEPKVRFGAIVAGGLIFFAAVVAVGLAVVGYGLLPPAGLPRLSVALLIVATCIALLGSAVMGYFVSRVSAAGDHLTGAFHGAGAWGFLVSVLAFAGGAITFQLIPPLTALATSTAIGAGSLAAVPTVWEQLVQLRPRAQVQMQLTDEEAQAYLVLDKPQPVSLAAIAQRILKQVDHALGDERLQHEVRPAVDRGRQLAGTGALLLAGLIILSGAGSALGGTLGGTPRGRRLERRESEPLPRAA